MKECTLTLVSLFLQAEEKATMILSLFLSPPFFLPFFLSCNVLVSIYPLTAPTDAAAAIFLSSWPSEWEKDADVDE